MEQPDYVDKNAKEWAKQAEEYIEPGRRSWSGEPKWGIWGISDEGLGLLPDAKDRDCIELGCGTAYVSSWLARRGGRPVGIDPTPEQLATAKMLQTEFDLSFPLVRAAAENLPFADDTFDVAVSEYGASIWSDPYLWIPEVARVLRPGGELMFLVNGTLAILCMPDEGPDTPELVRDYFGLHRLTWPDDDSVEFHLGYGDWIRLLRANGFEVEDMVELRPPEDATTRYEWASLEWSRRWPVEEVWKARKKP